MVNAISNNERYQRDKNLKEVQRVNFFIKNSIQLIVERFFHNFLITYVKFIVIIQFLLLSPI